MVIGHFWTVNQPKGSIMGGNYLGKRRTPVALKIVAGNPGKRALPEQPKVKKGNKELVPPDWLDDVGKEHWRWIVRELLDADIFSSIDKTSLAMYCDAYSRYQTANEKVKAHGMVLMNPKTKIPYISPFWKVANEAALLIHRYVVEFGMTPASRSKVSPIAKPKETGFDDF
jgi:P27 family predicted phage terminase small subunit